MDVLNEQSRLLSELDTKILSLMNLIQKNSEMQISKEKNLLTPPSDSSFLYQPRILFPSLNDIDGNFGQTSVDQYHLIQEFEKKARFQQDKETQLFSSFLTYYHFQKNESIILCSLFHLQHISNALTDNITLTKYQPTITNLNKIFITEIDKFSKSNYFFIINPYIANLILLSPEMIKQLSRKIKTALIFPIYYNQNLFSISWGNTFSSYENNEEHHWRWAVGSAPAHSLNITNNSLNTKNITLKYTLWITDDSITHFEIYFLNQYLEFSISHNIEISFELSVPPGNHQLTFHYKNKPIVNNTDARLLNFAIVDFTLLSDDGHILLEKNKIYSQDNNIDFNPISEDIIRHALHGNGFFEIESFKQQLNPIKFTKPSISRFHLINNFYEFPMKSLLEDEFESDVIWYIAKRNATLHEGHHV